MVAEATLAVVVVIREVRPGQGRVGRRDLAVGLDREATRPQPSVESRSARIVLEVRPGQGRADIRDLAVGLDRGGTRPEANVASQSARIVSRRFWLMQASARAGLARS